MESPFLYLKEDKLPKYFQIGVENVDIIRYYHPYKKQLMKDLELKPTLKAKVADYKKWIQMKQRINEKKHITNFVGVHIRRGDKLKLYLVHNKQEIEGWWYVMAMQNILKHSDTAAENTVFIIG